MRARRAALAALWLTACSAESPTPSPTPSDTGPSPSPSVPPSASASAASSEPRTPNELYARGTPTFVAGTLGDDHEDRVIRAQIEMIRGMLFPTAKVVDDTSIDVKAGPSAWPPNPVLYGGPQHNAVVAALRDELPFRMTGESLELDGHTLKGSGVQLITLVPARAAATSHPAFMLYAGTGPEGVAEINGLPHGESEIAVYDGFDSVAAGSWQRSAAGFTPQLNWAPERPPLADETLALKGTRSPAKVTFSTVVTGPYDDLPGRREAVLRGLKTSLDKLAIDAPTELRVVMYPNAETKKAYTHSAGDGHAAPAARTLHVRSFENKVLERLIAHEATHVYTAQLWGPPGTAFVGEGLAVWVAGQYGGTELADWKRTKLGTTPLATLLGAGFRRSPERETYPRAGLVVGAIVDRVGVSKLRDGLWSATPQTWQADCERAGIRAEQLEAAPR